MVFLFARLRKQASYGICVDVSLELFADDSPSSTGNEGGGVGGGFLKMFARKRQLGKMGLGLSRNEGLPYIEVFLEILHDSA